MIEPLTLAKASDVSGKRSTVRDGVFSNPAVERGLLGCLLRRADDLAMVGDRNLFTEPRHLAIFDIIRELHATGGQVDVWCIIERLPEHRDYVLDLMDEDKNPGAVTPLPLVRMVSACAARRKWDSVVKSLQGRIADGDTPAELAEFVRKNLDAQPAGGPGPARFRILSSDELLSRSPADQLVDETIVAGSLVVVHGDSDTLKSTLALDVACHIAIGKRWHGRAVKQGTALYVVAEGQAGMPQRLRAWKQAHGVPGNIAVGFIEEALDPLNEADVQALILQVRPAPPAVLVVDTWSAGLAAGVGDEDKNRDVARAIGAFKRFCTMFGTTVVVIHHEGHAASGRPRGGSALRANADTTIAVSRKDDVITIINPKQKDMPTFAPLKFRRAVVQCKDGTSSVVLMPCEESRLSDSIAKTLIALRDFGSAGASFTQWQSRTGYPETTFRRHVDRLCGENYVGKEGKGCGACYSVTQRGHGYRHSPGGGDPPPSDATGDGDRHDTATVGDGGSPTGDEGSSSHRHDRHDTATDESGGDRSSPPPPPPPYRGGGEAGNGGVTLDEVLAAFPGAVAVKRSR